MLILKNDRYNTEETSLLRNICLKDIIPLNGLKTFYIDIKTIEQGRAHNETLLSSESFYYHFLSFVFFRTEHSQQLFSLKLLFTTITKITKLGTKSL